jgi:hypothetical protein
MELAFVVFSAGGYGEVRVSSDGAVRVTDGSPAWVSLDGISFPTVDARIPSLHRVDVSPISQTAATAGGDLLFHYTRSETALKFILPNETLRLSSCRGTNDPRESKDWLFTLVCRANGPAPGEALRVSTELNRLIKDMTRLSCFCANTPPNVALAESSGAFHSRMWAQYSEDHKGIVLVFDGRRLLPDAQESLGSLGQLWFGPVEYVEHFDPGSFAFFLEYDEVLSTPAEELARRILSSRMPWLFFTKHVDWAQEEERRMVMLPRDGRDYFIPIRSSLVEIVLGADFPVAQLSDVRHQAARLGCSVSQVLWRNGFPVRTPIA